MWTIFSDDREGLSLSNAPRFHTYLMLSVLYSVTHVTIPNNTTLSIVSELTP